MQDSTFVPYGDRVRLLRHGLGLTQQTLAERAGLAIRTVIRVEQGEDARVGTLTVLAEVLGVSVSDLVRADEVQAS